MPNRRGFYISRIWNAGIAFCFSDCGSCARSSRIVLTPADGTLGAELLGDFATIVALAEAAAPGTKNPGSLSEPGLLSVVAGRGFEPLTFRL